ncbi:ribosome biogenesis GTPase YqeH, partial [Bacillus xiapuensis]|nr:ribosome biogenesis GTPase YqeH [Bacillus xiapuensis]
MSEQQNICMGCGVKVQTENPSELGYAPKAALDKEILICQRCFRLKHYNEVQDVSLTDDDFLKILNGLGQTDALIVMLVDIFDFNGSWLPGLHRFVGNNKVLLVGNKVDLLPKSVKHHKLINWMKHESRELGLRPEDILLVSAAKGHYIKEAAAVIDEMRRGKDVYVVGCTNVGKSTFINRIIKEVTGEEDVITTSHFPGTTLDIIQIPLDDGKSLIDTPGIINHHQMAHFVDKRDLKVITPKKEIKPKVFQLNEGQTLFFGGLARFDYI